eukprot:1137069-Rhodomonas_salina.1
MLYWHKWTPALVPDSPSSYAVLVQVDSRVSTTQPIYAVLVQVYSRVSTTQPIYAVLVQVDSRVSTTQPIILCCTGTSVLPR